MTLQGIPVKTTTYNMYLEHNSQPVDQMGKCLSCCSKEAVVHTLSCTRSQQTGLFHSSCTDCHTEPTVQLCEQTIHTRRKIIVRKRKTSVATNFVPFISIQLMLQVLFIQSLQTTWISQVRAHVLYINRAWTDVNVLPIYTNFHSTQGLSVATGIVWSRAIA